MIKVGLTGGIGSGKSTVARIFVSLGIPVYVSDARAKYLMDNDKAIVKKMTNYFGRDIYKNGQLQRKKLANAIFTDKLALEFVNSIVHPAVQKDFEKWVKRQDTTYVIKESAILFEAGVAGDLEYVITVYAPRELRISRVLRRDKVDRQKVEERMKNQWPEQKKIQMADFVIVNDDNTFVLPQVLNLHNFFLKQRV